MTVTMLPSARALLVWRHKTSGNALAGGRPMTADQALLFAEESHPNGSLFLIHPDQRITWTTQFGTRLTYVGEHPLPIEPHAVIDEMVIDLRLTVEQGALLERALRAAVDGRDATAHLLQPVATQAVTS